MCIYTRIQDKWQNNRNLRIENYLQIMPLKCLLNDEYIYAFDFEPEAWQQLKQKNKKEDILKFSCCDSSVVLKSNKHGTQFFAHAKVGECTSAPESLPHLMAKNVIAKGIIAAGWKACSEYRGSNGINEEWIADVLALKNNAKVAFEVQWSQQTEQETERRHIRYKESNVREVWFFKQKDFVSNQAIPAFGLSVDKVTNDFVVHIPNSHRFFRDYKNNWGWTQKILLSQFVEGALTGRLKWAPATAIDATITVDVHGAEVECWKCKKLTTALTTLHCNIDAKFPGHPSLNLKIYDFDDMPHRLHHVLAGNELSKFGVGEVKKRYSRTMNEKYISNGCIHVTHF